MDELVTLVKEFRSKIDFAFNEGLFLHDITFNRFPKACCGDACCLLAEYLKANGIQTIYVCGVFRNQSHAWLVLKDNTIHNPDPKYYTMPDEIKSLLTAYGMEVSDEPYNISKYEDIDLINGTLIDITADQFGQPPIYIGSMDQFHRKFIFDFAHDYNGLGNCRLLSLYNLIMRR